MCIWIMNYRDAKQPYNLATLQPFNFIKNNSLLQIQTAQ